MDYKKELTDVVKDHKEEIEKDDYVPLILDVYLRCGAGGLAALKEMLGQEADLGKHYNRAVAKIVKTLLKNSDLLNED